MIKKPSATPILTLNRMRSAPRRVWKTLPSWPKTLPRLVPRDCIRMRPIKLKARISSAILRVFFNGIYASYRKMPGVTGFGVYHAGGAPDGGCTRQARQALA